MARLRRLGRKSLKYHQSAAQQLEVLAIAQLATAEDGDDEILGLTLAALAADHRRKSRSKKYGIRGEYNQPKSEDFFNILLGQASERQFKAWFRTCNRPQRPVYYQLATFLCRLGAESGLKTAGVMSIAEGSVLARRATEAVSLWRNG
ncbi:hypothetical protein DEU56DRAFT_757387 [Suillus clintonianus]|uniref:uncharacterized protein n=1 Tax=Suillus clintonianus TaxID=1904413 RepID=UPI001B87C08E|nr:uncharacterized protein DEU56DRAFT_757387 [Suillus clintonianus]KAG2132032.1 hypothetical protein DEU56DRAFT_757387 [Suillus clintonianus]